MLVFHPAISMLFVVSWNNDGFLLWVRWWYFAEVLFRLFPEGVVGLINSVLRELLFHSVSILETVSRSESEAYQVGSPHFPLFLSLLFVVYDCGHKAH